MKYWAYINNETQGPFEKEELIKLPDFSNSTLICPQSPIGEKTQDWKEAASYPEIAAIIADAGLQSSLSPTTNENTPHSLKSLSISDINNPAKTETQNLAAPTIEVGKLSSLSSKKEEAPKEQIIGSDKFDPISISKIGKNQPPTEELKSPNPIDPLSLSQITRKQQDFFKNIASSQMPPASDYQDISPNPENIPPISPIQGDELTKNEQPLPSQTDNTANSNKLKPIKIESPEITNNDIPKSEPINQTPSQEAPAIYRQPDRSSEIIKLIEKFTENTATKDDIDKLKSYIDNKIDDVQRKIANISVSNIDNSLKQIELRLSNIEGKINFLQPPKQPELLSPFEMHEAPLQAEKPDKKEEIIEKEPVKDKVLSEEKNKKGSVIGKVIKVIYKTLLIIILIAAIGGVTIFALKEAEIIDITKFIPIPYFSRGESKQVSEMPQQEIIKSTETIVSVSTQAETTLEKPKDLSEEVIYFVRTYTADGGGTSLENNIISIGKKNKWKVQQISWSGKMEENNIYSITCSIPSKKGIITLPFQVDYTAKTIKPLNAYSKKALDMLILPKTNPPIKKKSQSSKNIQKKTQAKTSTPKQISKPQPAEDEEYVYEYVDEDEVGNDEEYVMPGVPKKK